MKFDQVMELSLLASMVGTPLLCNWSLCNTDFDWLNANHTMPAAIQALLKQFGSFHKGKTQQHSTSNNTTIKHLASGTMERKAKLKAVMRELFWWIEHIDSKADCGCNCPEELVQTMKDIIG